MNLLWKIMSLINSTSFPIDGFPQVVPLNSLGSEVRGFINVLNEEFFITLCISPGEQRNIVNLKGRWKLQQLLKPVMDVLEQRLTMCDTVVDMLKEIHHAIEQQMRKRDESESILLPIRYYDCLLRQLGDLGWTNVHRMDDDLKVIELTAVDRCSREHSLRLNLPQDFPNASPAYVCDLPEEFVFQWSPNKTLLDLYKHFKFCLVKFCEFWNWLEEIDELTWVLEPDKPTRSSCKRRIAIAPSASILVIINPASLLSVPICQFLGPDSVVAPLKQKFTEKMFEWNGNRSLLTNLKSILNIEFPSPLTSNKEEFCIACGICYSYKLGDELPEVICSELKCKQPYHRTCLYEWFKSLPTTRQNFNTVFGDCPYCNMTLWFTLQAL